MAVIEDLGIWRTARRLLDQLGDEAAMHVVQEARDKLEAGNIANLRRYQRILHAVERLKRVEQERRVA